MFSVEGGRLIRKKDWETLVIEAWGTNALRVRATRRRALSGNDWALLPKPELPDGAVVIGVEGETATIRNGELECRINDEGWLSFYDGSGWSLGNAVENSTCPQARLGPAPGGGESLLEAARSRSRPRSTRFHYSCATARACRYGSPRPALESSGRALVRERGPTGATRHLTVD